MSNEDKLPCQNYSALGPEGSNFQPSVQSIYLRVHLLNFGWSPLRERHSLSGREPLAMQPILALRIYLAPDLSLFPKLSNHFNQRLSTLMAECS
jgi:hypothetical protein